MSQLVQQIDAIIDAAVTNEKIVGCHVIIKRGGQTAYQRAAGFADREAGRAMEPDAIFRLASVTKPICCAAALALVEQGKLALDQLVTQWLPDFQPTLPDGSPTQISLSQLITHTAGLHYLDPAPDAPYRLAHVASGISGPIISLEETLKRMATVPLKFAPGTAWHYSLATDVLGAIIAKCFGGTLDDAIDSLITGPLKMSDTAFTLKDEARLTAAYADGQIRPDRMKGDHHIATGQGKGTRLSAGRATTSGAYNSGGSGMLGTAPDIIKFLETLRVGGGSILTRSSVENGLKNQIGTLREETDPGYGFTHFSTAILTDPARAKSPCGNGTIRWGGVFGHAWFIDPAAEITALVMTNTAVEGGGGKFPDDIRDAIYAS